MLLTTCKSCALWLLNAFLIATSHANPTQGAIPTEIAEAPSSQLSQEHADEHVVAIRRYVPAVPQKKRNPKSRKRIATSQVGLGRVELHGRPRRQYLQN